MFQTLPTCQCLNPRSSNFQSLLKIKNDSDDGDGDNDDDNDNNGDSNDDDDVKRLEERHP